jgi:hypothetical protein
MITLQLFLSIFSCIGHAHREEKREERKSAVDYWSLDLLWPIPLDYVSRLIARDASEKVLCQQAEIYHKTMSI